jgi:hypothetical protein
MQIIQSSNENNTLTRETAVTMDRFDALIRRVARWETRAEQEGPSRREDGSTSSAVPSAVQSAVPSAVPSAVQSAVPSAVQSAEVGFEDDELPDLMDPNLFGWTEAGTESDASSADAFNIQ